MDDDLSTYGDLGDLYDRYRHVLENPTHPDFARFLRELESFAEAGDPEAAEALGDWLSAPGANYKPEEAYKWYYIGFSQIGYSVLWEDRNHSPPYYCGPVGDFRNESQVSELVISLGWQRVRELDAEASQWLKDRGLT